MDYIRKVKLDKYPDVVVFPDSSLETTSCWRVLNVSFGIAFLLRYHRPILHAAWRIPALTTSKLPTVAIFRFPFREILNGAWITNGPHPKPYQFSSMPHFGGSCPVAVLEDYPEER
ncbi:hypothetical protein CDAR_555681 [Caerostris darwini]|uniref:Uncharacterized protein n=1 Tax=Caerostris darwini TaxID=1538125 RepID=A0AAV4QZT0_9ARAC|nr:hypothetical protein CDAR_555681 [Caerostris darwini]